MDTALAGRRERSGTGDNWTTFTGDRLTEAVAAFRAACAITRADGIVRRVLRLLDAIAIADPAATLTVVRTAAAGEDG